MDRNDITRRLFLIKSGAWCSRVLLLSLLPGCTSWRKGMTSEELNGIVAGARALSLREISEKELHHGKGFFINPFTTEKHGGLWRLLRWKLFSRNRFRNQHKDEEVKQIHLDWSDFLEQGECALVFIKHSCIAIRDRDRILLIDPIFSGLFMFEDFSPIASGLEEMPRPDHILITHGHYDHLDVPTLRKLDPKTHVVTPLGYEGVFDELEMQNRTQLDWFREYRDGDLSITLIPCHHWTMRNPIAGPNRSLWGSYLIKCAGGRTIFISGDVAYFDRYEEIGREFDIDLAVFNLGAYEPRWFMRHSHINPEETVRAFKELKAERLLVVHWGTFRLGDEPVGLPLRDIRREMKKAGLGEHLVELVHGETMDLSSC